MKILHKEDCKRIFKRYDESCPRCKELLNGAKPRKGWFEKNTHVYESVRNCRHNNTNPGGYCNTCSNGRDFS